MALAVGTAAAVGSFLVVRRFVPFVLAACAYATAQSGLAAARQALLAGLVAAGERTGLLAHLQATLNAGLAVGAGLGGLALQAGTRAAYLGVFALDALSFLVCAGVLLRLPPVAPDGVAAGGKPDGRGVLREQPVRNRDRLGVLRDRPYAVLALLNTVLVGWGTPGWLLPGGATVMASYAMGPATRRAAVRTGDDVGWPVPVP